MTLPLYISVAVAKNGVIGRDGGMPWHLATDLQRFKQLTLGNPVIMGRKTWDSIGRPLPQRCNIVISRQLKKATKDVFLAHSFQEALDIANCEGKKLKSNAIFVIGGETIFAQALPFVDKMFITQVLDSIAGDTFFPEFEASQWTATTQDFLPANEKNSHATQFVVYDRLQKEPKNVNRPLKA